VLVTKCFGLRWWETKQTFERVVFYKNSTLKKKRFLAALEFIIKRNPTQISKQQSSTDLTQAFDRTFIKIGSFVNLQKPMKKSFLLQQ
jgi:dimeric dUTPase (all-alpha-NTP-PPase superfamily)